MAKLPAALLLLVALTPAFAGEAFLAELEDLPLAPGLTELPGGLLFDSVDGRIVEARASGEVDRDQIELFYDSSLGQLGWQRIAPLQFRRDNEVLKILLDGKGKILTVHFSLNPSH